MGKNSRRRRIISVSFLSACFLGALVFSGYYELYEVDIFSPILTFETQDLPTLTGIEKVKLHLSIAYSDFSLPTVSFSEQIQSFVFPISLGEQLNSRLRC